MNDHKSFRVSDFSIKDVPLVIVVFFILSLFSIGVGWFIESMTDFWRGVFVGVGVGLGFALIAALWFFRPSSKPIDASAFPRPSAKTLDILKDPNQSFIDAVKAYRDETGLGLTETTAVMRAFRDQDEHSLR